jgi:hypothetical protein
VALLNDEDEEVASNTKWTDVEKICGEVWCCWLKLKLQLNVDRRLALAFITQWTGV